MHLLYLLQMAIWIGTCFSHRFVEERHKDYVMMCASPRRTATTAPHRTTRADAPQHRTSPHRTA